MDKNTLKLLTELHKRNIVPLKRKLVKLLLLPIQAHRYSGHGKFSVCSR